MKGHRKHAKLKRPSGGMFHRNETGFIGAPCGTITSLAEEIARRLSSEFRIGYADASHGETPDMKGLNYRYTDNAGLHREEFPDEYFSYTSVNRFVNAGGVFVNGNHFPANRQVVIINREKEASLERKLDKITDPVLVILDEGIQAPFDFLKPVLDNVPHIPVLRKDDIEGISEVIAASWRQNVPGLRGLVLAGGKSERMGTDKGLIAYNGKPQRAYAADLLSEVCDEVFISVRDRKNESLPVDRFLEDTFTGLGPYGAILTAFQSDPDSAWLVLACDLPLVDADALKFLVGERDHSKTATCFQNEATSFPEPLITIWEPRAYPRMLEFLAQGYSCPRKVLINSDIRLVDPPDQRILLNVNTPEERDRLKHMA